MYLKEDEMKNGIAVPLMKMGEKKIKKTDLSVMMT